MYIKSLDLQDFRCYKSLNLSFDKSLTTIVGENNTGKSTIWFAIDRLLVLIRGDQDDLSREDWPHGIKGQSLLRLTLVLEPTDTQQLLLDPLLNGLTPNTANELRQWLLQNGNELEITFHPESRHPRYIRWSYVTFYPTGIGIGSHDPARATSDWPSKSDGIYRLHVKILDIVSRQLANKLRLVGEFRTRSPGTRSPATESLTGSETASVLLNLKNHRERTERDRYIEIVYTFKNLYPQYEIEAVENQAGGANPELLFYENNQQNPISLQYVSAGVHQVLTLLTMLIARRELIIFLEHPEQHLHPHASRFVGSLLSQASQHNQIIVVTHDPHFVDPWRPQGLRRFWRTTSGGTKAFAFPTSSNERQLQQIQTALRHLNNREMVFARAVIVVEDESQRDFILGVAPTLGRNLDVNSISVVYADGQDGFRPIITFLEALQIPHVCLKDLDWGDNQRYPPSRFYSLGGELEVFLDSKGLAERRKQVIAEVGQGKRRVARALGQQLAKNEIPEVFDNLLEAAITIATGSPQHT